MNEQFDQTEQFSVLRILTFTLLDCAPVFIHPSGQGVSPVTDTTRYPAVVGLVCHLHHTCVVK